MKPVALFIPARLESARLPRKLVLPFAGTTIIDIALAKLHEVQFPCRKYFLAWHTELIEKNIYDDIETIVRSEDSAVCDGPLTRSFADLKSVKQDYLMFLNPCLTMLKPSTIDSALEKFSEIEENSMTSVILHRNWFFNAETGECLTSINYKELNSKHTVPVHSFANAFHIGLKVELFRSGKFLNQDTISFQIPYHEAYDVNDPLDITVAEALYQSRERIWSYEK
jgi:CMP-N-acetylneuraminic acid synthetase